MLNVGVIGLGSMGNTHLDAYSKLSTVQVVAISDANLDRLHGKAKAAGNIEGQAKGAFDLSQARKYPEGMDLIADPQIDIVDICLHTPLHFKYARAALAAGKHVLLEKPICRTVADAEALVKLADASGKKFMVAQCMRFWPGWNWLKDAVANQTYGKVLGAHFRRVSSHPGGPFYESAEQCGGAILDLHIHDTDFINHLFGKPKSVTSFGYSSITTAVDHVFTHYHYDNIPLVVAEGGWCMAKGFGFTMQYTINFQNATAIYDLGAAEKLTVVVPGQKPAPIPLDPRMGYELEIAYFIDCVNKGVSPTVSTGQTSLDSLRIVEAEVQSVATGKTVAVA